MTIVPASHAFMIIQTVVQLALFAFLVTLCINTHNVTNKEKSKED